MKLALPLLLLAAWPSFARADLEKHGFAELAAGASIPELDKRYQTFAISSFKGSLRGGYELWTPHIFGFAPEAQLDFIPVTVDDAKPAYQKTTATGGPAYSVSAPFFRLRALGGGRFLFNFGPGAGYIRIMAGVDYLTGTEKATPLETHGPVPARVAISSAAFTVQPGAGVQFHFWSHFLIGISIDLPIALYDFGKPDLAGVQKFTAIDCDLMGTLGYRF